MDLKARHCKEIDTANFDRLELVIEKESQENLRLHRENFEVLHVLVSGERLNIQASKQDR